MKHAVLLAVLLAACADNTSTGSQPVVYGNDDRQDVYAFADQTWAARANEVSAAMIQTTDIHAGDPQHVTIDHGTLAASFDVCADERFATQPTAAGCSGSLIAPDLILTAGHCVTSQSGCNHVSFVFNWSMTDATTLHQITTDDVYQCASIVARQQTGTVDFAVVRLDREVVGRTPAIVKLDNSALANDTPLVVQGYPSTIPLKIDDGGAVRDGRPGTLDYFVANLDTFGGNSGSGVYLDDGTLVGILVRGESDYVTDGNCERVHVCAEAGCMGEESTYVYRAVSALCQASPTAGLCACSDGSCDGAGGESTVTCPQDCGSLCGDGACNGTESPLDCTDDCGFCGNNACDNGETSDTCCDDCPCTVDGDVCHAHTCIDDPAIGDSCATAIEIEPSGTQTFAGTTELSVDDLAGSCYMGSGGAPDRVYTFTLDGETTIDAHVTGYDTILYLEASCGVASTELACNDDVANPDDLTSAISTTLAAGTYALVVDGFTDESGPYELTVTFASVGGPDAGGDDGGDGGGCCSTGGGSGGAGGSVLLALLMGLFRRRSPAALRRGRAAPWAPGDPGLAPQSRSD